ncbi:MAG: hypothetical protein J5829_00825 [Lachnospiraceae bacterium]|nr:hypothetical protein [Lachnospiraceae bacterium]
MRKAISILLVMTMFAAVFTGCGKKENDAAEPVKEEVSSQAAAEKKEDAPGDEKAEDNKEEEKKTPEAFDPSKLEFADRFLAGNRNVYHIEDDGSLKQVLRCTEEGESIVFAGGDKDHYYLAVNEEGMKYTLYYQAPGDVQGSCGIKLPDNTSINHMAAYLDRFYYDYYDGTNDEYPIWYYDPEKDDFVRDQEMERMTKYLNSYKGKNMTVLDYTTFVPKELAKTDHMFRKNTDDGMIVVFDKEGNEIYSVVPPTDSSDWDIIDDTYLIENCQDYTAVGRISNTQATVFNIKTGIYHPLWEGENDVESFSAVMAKDGYFYYYIEELNPDSSPKCRKYYREKAEELDNKDLNGELLAEIPVWNGVSSGYISEDRFSPDGFSVKGSRAYYLWFDDEKDSRTRGDISWRAVDMERLQFDDDTIVTGADERHEDFADLGSIDTEKEAEKKDGFRYFTSSRDRFYFHDDVENAVAMNETLKKIYDEQDGFAKDTKDTAYNDVFGSESSYDLDDPDAWAPAYSYDVNLGGAERIGSRHIEVTLNDYVYYGGAHGMPGTRSIIFDSETGNEVTMKDLFQGSEKEFRDIVVQYSMDDWKNSGDYKYYESYDPSLEKDKKKEFEELAGFDMLIDYAKDGVNVGYSPYAVGPFSSGFIEIFIPYSALGMEEEMK